MAHSSDNKPTEERRPMDEIDLRPKDLCAIERYFMENGASEFVYDEKLDVFCFPEDLRVAFCDEFADWKRLRERGYLNL
jgi:hypothetical protein